VSTVVKVAAVVEMAALTDKIALLRAIISVDNTPVSAVSAAANDTDALLNALDNDATALPRATLSVEIAVTNPVSIATRDGIAVLLKDAIALMRADVSNDTDDFNPDTLLNVLALTVRLELVCISDTIFSNMLNLVVTPLNTLEIAVDMLEVRFAVSFINSPEIVAFVLARDTTATDTCDEMEFI